ncbi:unnamed protein product [Pseudo-nitzschia multistriata]|uniref:Uncharacterized protein n=1 Tax=Pseudo-nitzschia multistriata TaxID=183589 RepID=A0A448ZDT1_9STRA|nr:unnamed protein product [Pseudo-nitzschia multistriata]
MPNQFFITSPEIATVGQSGQAYLQRTVVIVLAVACIGINIFNLRADCRLVLFTWTVDLNAYELERTANVTNTVSDVLGVVGIQLDNSNRNFDILDYYVEGDDGLYFGLNGFAFVNSKSSEYWNKKYKCVPFDSLPETKITMTEEDVKFFDSIKTVAILSSYFGFAGVLCAFVEFLFCVFYPSVIAGSVFLALAAFMNCVYLLLYYLGSVECFTAGMCKPDLNFFSYLFTTGGFFFASCLLVFGFRTYPWFLRKNRDPANCKVVEADIVDEEGYDRSEHQEEQGGGVPIEAYRELEEELAETKRRMLRAERELQDYLAQKAGKTSPHTGRGHTESNASNDKRIAFRHYGSQPAE